VTTYNRQKTIIVTRHSTEAEAIQQNFKLVKGEVWRETDSTGHPTGRSKTGFDGQVVNNVIVGTAFVDLPFDPIGAGPPLYVITTTYTASGAILPTDNVSLVNAANPAIMTLAAGPSDGHGLLVKRLGAGAVTITANLDSTISSIVADSTTIKESVVLSWSSGLGTWLIL
jgi:hypothetical protein